LSGLRQLPISAVTKLCKGIISTTNLETIVDKLNSLDLTYTKKFLIDVDIDNGNNNALSKNLNNLTTNLIDSWVYMYTNYVVENNPNTSFTKDFALLQKVHDIKNNTADLAEFSGKGNKITNLGLFVANYKNARCNTCTFNGGYQTGFDNLDKILTQTLAAQKNTNIAPKTNYTEFAKSEPFSANLWGQDGGQHMINGIVYGITLPNGTVFDFKNYIANIDQPFGSTVADGALAKKQYDVLLTGAPNNIRFIEFKSCKGTDTESIIETKKVDIPKNAQFVDQFLAYLSDQRLLNLNGLLYVFNKKKTTTLESAKLIIQGVFLGAKKDKIYETILPKLRPIFTFDPIPSLAKIQYDNLVNDLNSILYNFITIN
jgi:hypothetical protein